MKKSNIPVIYSAHHASSDFGAFASRCGLTQEQRLRFSDLGTYSTVPTNGLLTLRGAYSRALGDLNRPPGIDEMFPVQDFARPRSNPIWLPGQMLSIAQRQVLKKTHFEVYHNHITEVLHERCARGADTYVVAWDNTGDYVIGTDPHGADVQMPNIILSNRGDEGVTTGAYVTCDPRFLQSLGAALSEELLAAGLPHDVQYNQVFFGGYITRRHTNYTLRDSDYNGASVQSLQLEYNMALTHDQETLEEIPGRIDTLRKAFERAIEQVLAK